MLDPRCLAGAIYMLWCWIKMQTHAYASAPSGPGLSAQPRAYTANAHASFSERTTRCAYKPNIAVIGKQNQNVAQVVLRNPETFAYEPPVYRGAIQFLTCMR